MPLPKRRHSNARTRKRRAHDALKPVAYTHCTHCDAPVRSHSVCNNCGYYRDQQVLVIKEKKPKTAK